MGLRDRWRAIVRASNAYAADQRSTALTTRGVTLSWQDSPFANSGVYGVSQTATLAARVSREEALQVPAVLRGRNLICSPASLPMRCIDADRKPVRLSLLEQIDPFVPNVVTLAQTFEDLLFESISWWKVNAFGWDGFPVEARHIDVRAVSMTPPEGYPLHTLPSGGFPNGLVWVMGEPVGAESMIRFDSPNPPLLIHAARAIRWALKLEQAADRYADDPRMQAFFTPADGADPATDPEIEDILTQWQLARQRRTTGYVPASLKYNPIDVMSPADLQLSELQLKATLGLANAMGIDPEDMGVSTTTRTYRNAVDRRQDRINETYAMYLKAITDRLSMGDVTPRGKRIVFDLDDFLKADPKSRWETYGIAAGLDAITIDEIRAKEEWPALTPAQKAAMQPRVPVVLPDVPKPLPPAATKETPVPVKNSTGPAPARFAAEPQSLTFDAPADATFRVDLASRTITGLAVPYGPVARSGWAKWRFRKGSLTWTDAQRVKLLIDHDTSQAIGYATELEETDAGLRATFKIARGDDGDEALLLAEDHVLDGMSIGVEFTDPDAWMPDPSDDTVRLVMSARLRETSLCALPAFDGARVDGVKASTTGPTPPGPVPAPTTPAPTPTDQEFAMPCQSCGQVHAAGTPCATPPPAPAPTFAGQPAPTPPIPAQPGPADLAAFTAAVEAFTTAVGAMGQMPAEQRRVVPVGAPTVQEPLVYSLTGAGASFVRDAWVVRTREGGATEQDDAAARLRKYEAQTAELQLAASQRIAFANAGNTTDQASIIPPGYRPDLYVGQIPQGRPLAEAMSRGTIANATPFNVPVWVGAAGLSGTNVEGTGPTGGTMTNHTLRTVTPTAQSGKFVITRELIDSSNPAIDQIALMAMREEYSQDTEAVIATALAAATDNDTGSGQSTEGCYVYTALGDGVDLGDAIDSAWARFPFTRFTVSPDRLLIGQTGFSAMVHAKDGSGRKMYPFMGPQNASGTTGVASQSIDVSGLPGRPAWSLTTGTDDVVTFNHVDAWAWESPLLMFRFDEVQGPANIVLALWAYFAFQILRYPGIHAIAYTGS